MHALVRIAAAVVVSVVTATAGVAVSELPGAAAGAVHVTSGLDSGAGTLRDAIEAANADPSLGIVVVSPQVGTVELADVVTYTGAQPLKIQGNGVTITPEPGAGDFDLVASTGGAALSVQRLTLEGATGIGLRVAVPEDAGADQLVALDGVVITGSALNGLYIDDCQGTDPPTQCPPDVTGSPVGVRLDVANSEISGNGIGDLADFDGIRLDERSAGDAIVTISQSVVTLNDADGIEVDESDAGHVVVEATSSSFVDNGEQPQASDDPEDAIDVDERGDGDVIANLRQVEATGNYDENLDFNEADGGDLRSSLDQVTVEGARAGRGYDLEELGVGSIVSELNGTSITTSLDDGMRAQERDLGDVVVSVNQSSFVDNGAAGVEVDQRGGGGGTADFKNSAFSGNAQTIQNESSPLTSITITTKNVSGL